MLRLSRNPKATDAVFKIADELRLRKNAVTKQMVDRALADKNFKTLLERGLRNPNINIEQLKRLPEDTLGYAFAKHMIDHNLQVDFYPEIKVIEPIDFWTLRMRQSHDMWHVLAGFDTSVLGEVGVQAFTLAQTRAALSVFLIAGSMLTTIIRRPTEILDLFDSIQTGYARGRNAQYLLGYELDLMWERKLDDLRQEFGIRSSP